MIGMDGGFSINLTPAPMPQQSGASSPEAGAEPGFQATLERQLATASHGSAPPASGPAGMGLAGTVPPATAPAAPVLAGGALPVTPEIAAQASSGLADPSGAAATPTPAGGGAAETPAALPGLRAPPGLNAPPPPEASVIPEASPEPEASPILDASLGGEPAPMGDAPAGGLMQPDASRQLASSLNPAIAPPCPGPMEGEPGSELLLAIETSLQGTADTGQVAPEEGPEEGPMEAGEAYHETAEAGLATAMATPLPAPAPHPGAPPPAAAAPATAPPVTAPPVTGAVPLAEADALLAAAAGTSQSMAVTQPPAAPEAGQPQSAPRPAVNRGQEAPGLPQLPEREAPEGAALPTESSPGGSSRGAHSLRAPEIAPHVTEPKPPESRPAAASSATPASGTPASVLSWGFEIAPPRLTDAPPPASNAPPPPPIRQLAPIAVALAFTPGAANGFQLSLEPAELGRVEIRVQREGEAHSIRIVAERPETLALLLRDRQELDRGLADAGLRVEAKGIEFSLGAQSGQPDQGAPGEQRAPGSRRAGGGMAAPPQAEPPAPRALRGLLDLQI